jgi:hypothetical protein
MTVIEILCLVIAAFGFATWWTSSELTVGWQEYLDGRISDLEHKGNLTIWERVVWFIAKALTCLECTMSHSFMLLLGIWSVLAVQGEPYSYLRFLPMAFLAFGILKIVDRFAERTITITKTESSSDGTTQTEGRFTATVRSLDETEEAEEDDET